MRILLIGLNYSPEAIGIGPYTTGVAEAFAAAGYEVKVIAGKPYYPTWRLRNDYMRPWYHQARENDVQILRAPHYVPNTPTGLRRILHHLSFALSIAPVAIYNAVTFRPKIIISVAPSILSTPIARISALLCSAQLWLHIHDFEVEAAFATGLMKQQGLVSRLARAFEVKQIRSANLVTTISPQMLRKLIEKGAKSENVLELRNWADVDQILPTTSPLPYRTKWKLAEKFIALYSGNIANKQGIETIIEAAKELKHRRDLIFVICGEGPNRAHLEAIADGADNIVFRNLQPRKELGSLLAIATIHLLPQIADAEDLVLPSKLGNMLASGKPVIATVSNGSGIADELKECGIIVPPGDVKAFARAVEALIDDNNKLSQMGIAARARAEDFWGRKSLLNSFVDVAENLLEQPHLRSL